VVDVGADDQLIDGGIRALFLRHLVDRGRLTS
jgi:hypothetical protein